MNERKSERASERMRVNAREQKQNCFVAESHEELKKKGKRNEYQTEQINERLQIRMRAL